MGVKAHIALGVTMRYNLKNVTEFNLFSDIVSMQILNANSFPNSHNRVYAKIVFRGCYFNKLTIAPFLLYLIIFEAVYS